LVPTLKCLVLALLLISNAAAQQDKDNAVRTLDPAKPITQDVKGGESYKFELKAESGQFIWLAVDQDGINISLAVFDPAGKTISDADAYLAGFPEEILFISASAGTYRVEVRSPDKNAIPGRVTVNVKALRTATDKDNIRVRADTLTREALLLYRQHTNESAKKAITKYLEAQEQWHTAGQPHREATAFYMISALYGELGDKQKALEYANRAMPFAEAAERSDDAEVRRGGLESKAYILDALGTVHNGFGDKKKGLDYFQQALEVRRLIKDKPGEANTLNNIAMAYGGLGEWPKALEALTQSRAIVRELGNRRDEAILLNNMCAINKDLGQYKQALESCDDAIKIAKDLKAPDVEGVILNSTANVYSELGEYQEALDFYNRSLTIYQTVGLKSSQAIELHNIAWLHGMLGEREKANDIYNQALAIFRGMGNRSGEANTLSNIGVNYMELGDFRKALDIHQQVLPIRREVSDFPGEAITLNNLGGSYFNLNEKQKALDYYNQALAIHRKMGNLKNAAATLKNLGSVYMDLGDNSKAYEALNEGLKISRSIGDRNTEAGILSFMAKLERNRGNLVEARQRIDEALKAIELLRTSIKSQQLRASFTASFRKLYELNVNILMRLHQQQPTEGFDALALAASEQGRARSLLELLTESAARIRQGVNPQLVERERALRQKIAEKAERQMRLRGGPHTDEQVQAATKELDTLTTDYEQVLAEIRQSSPRYAALTQPKPLSVEEIQKQVLDNDTLLLEYALGEEKSFLWALTPSSIKSFELPKRSEIEATARKLYDLITGANQNVPDETPAQRTKRIAEEETNYRAAAAELSRMLFGPVASDLKNKRLLVVGDGVLQYVPFAVLSRPDSDVPLVVEHEIITLPSASVLAVLRKETRGRKPAAKTVAVLADPVFDSSDPRLKGPNRNPSANTTTDSLSDVNRSASESGLRGFARLRFSRQEAEQIEQLVPGNKKFKALDFAASRPTALTSELSDYRIIHFATHGLINNQHPDLSGMVLSLVDEQGKPQNGFVRLYDIYNMNLNADLVVLSACQTALGKEIKGEGLIGLTRAFMYAGAPRVVASLWQVDDRATAEVMARFYKGMLGSELRPAEALRAAQISMWKEKRWQAPRYWAGFTLQGEWK
jgi:CHAT domain-containing protein